MYKWFRIGLALVLFLFFLPFWAGFYYLGHLNFVKDELSGFIYKKENIGSERKLGELRLYHNFISKIPIVESAANRYLFKEFSRFEAAQDYLDGLFGEARRKVKDDQTYMGYYINANAKIREQQDEYRKALEIKDKKLSEDMKERVHKTVVVLSRDYGEALENFPARQPLASIQWNYDMILNDKVREQMLKPSPGRGKRKILIFEGEKDGNRGKGDPSKKNKDSDPQKDAGSSNPPERTG